MAADRRSVESILIKFLAEEVDLAWNFVDVARIERERGMIDRRRDFLARAGAICSEAEWRVSAAQERGWTVDRRITEPLQALRNALAENERTAEWVGDGRHVR